MILDPLKTDMPNVFKRSAFSLLLLLLLTACAQDKERNAEFFVFGTIVEVKLWGVSEEHASQAFSALQVMFQGMHRDWHAWEPGRLTDINNAFARGESAIADKAIVEMIRRSQVIEEKSDGRFNPAIGGLIKLWGFHTSEYPVIGPAPTQEQISSVLNLNPSSSDITITGLELYSGNPAVLLDFGGIAKGYAIDLSIQLLRELGIHNAIVNAGGDLRAIGRHGQRPWRVAVRKPAGGSIGSIDVQNDEAIFTSGNYERFRQHETQRYPHILDPRSGWPAKDIASVTVISDEGLYADAAATALVVAGLSDWPEVARALGLNQVAVVDESGKVYLTSQMEQRMQFAEDVQRSVIDLGYSDTSH